VTDYTSTINQIANATTLDGIRNIVAGFSAKSDGAGGILYSGRIGDEKSIDLAKQLAQQTGAPIIDKTERARLLSESNVQDAIVTKARQIFESEGNGEGVAKQLANDFLNGNPDAVATAETSVKNSLWGQASKEFAGSLRGDVQVVATNAELARIFGSVELPGAMRGSW